MYKAQEVSETAAPELYSIVRNLALKATLPMPRVYIIPEETANAFATGRNTEHAVVAVTEGIMRILNKEELEGVIAHELSHIKNGDMLIASIAATIAGAIGMLATMAQWAAIFGGGHSDDDDRHWGDNRVHQPDDDHVRDVGQVRHVVKVAELVHPGLHPNVPPE